LKEFEKHLAILVRSTFMKNLLLLGLLAIVSCVACQRAQPSVSKPAELSVASPTGVKPDNNWANLSDKDWKTKLTPEQYSVLREAGTERPYTGAYWDHFEDGNYRCAGCSAVLFDSKTKFPCEGGWPAFWQPEGSETIKYIEDNTFGMKRVEVQCARCNGHLGHVFDDGPKPTGQRFCINSESLIFSATRVSTDTLSNNRN
jgi:peptide-methionine (R)-S-oxide reductase